MVTMPNYQPGVPSQASLDVTQLDAIWFHAPSEAEYGKTTQDLPVYSLVGRVTGTGLVVLSSPTAVDGSQNPIGITSREVVSNDSNSGLLDSNSLAGSDVENVSWYKNGQFNYERINKDPAWTLDLLKQATDRSPLGFDVIRTASPGTPST